MKYIIGFLLSVYSLNSYSEFLHPMDYTGTAAQDKQLSEYISQQVKKEQCTMSKKDCEIKMEATKVLELDHFLKLTKQTDRKKIDTLISLWCNSIEEPCYYGIISMMYE